MGRSTGGRRRANQGQSLLEGLPFSFTSEGAVAPLVIQQYKPVSYISRALAYIEGREYWEQIQRGRVPLAFAHVERQADGRYELWTYVVRAQDVRPDTQHQLIRLINDFGRLC